MLPNFEIIIAKALKVRINEERLEELNQTYDKSVNPLKKNKTNKIQLENIRNEALAKIEEEHVELEDVDEQANEMEEQQAKSSD